MVNEYKHKLPKEFVIKIDNEFNQLNNAKKTALLFDGEYYIFRITNNPSKYAKTNKLKLIEEFVNITPTEISIIFSYALVVNKTKFNFGKDELFYLNLFTKILRTNIVKFTLIRYFVSVNNYNQRDFNKELINYKFKYGKYQDFSFGKVLEENDWYINWFRGVQEKNKELDKKYTDYDFIKLYDRIKEYIGDEELYLSMKNLLTFKRPNFEKEQENIEVYAGSKQEVLKKMKECLHKENNIIEVETPKIIPDPKLNTIDKITEAIKRWDFETDGKITQVKLINKTDISIATIKRNWKLFKEIVKEMNYKNK